MNSTVFNKAALIAATCTAVQAIIWFALSLVGLLTAVDVIEAPGYSNSKPSEALPYNIVKCFFSDVYPHCCEGLLMRGSGMLVTSIVYMIMCLAWLCVATMLIVDLLKQMKHLSALTKTWASTTIIVCVLDLVVAILFGVDYAKMENKKYIILTEEIYACGSIHLEASGFLMSLAARGYVLWILNLAMAIWLLRSTSTSTMRNSSMASSETSDNYKDPIDAITKDIFPKRPWMDREKLAASQTPSLAPSDDFAAASGTRSQQDPVIYAQINRHRENQRGSLPQSPVYGPMSPASPSPRPNQSPSQLPLQGPGEYPSPQFGRIAVPPRSVLKKPPPPPSMAPAPVTPVSPSNNFNFPQQVPTSNNNWQHGAGDNGGRPQNYDRRF